MLKSYLLCVIKINALLFHLGQAGKMFLICVAQTTPCFFVRFLLLKLSYLPIISTSVAILNIVLRKTL